MRKPPPFDGQYEVAGRLAESIAAEGAYCVAAIGAFSGDETRSADEIFIEQNVRFQAHIADAAGLDAQLAELVFALDRLTAEVSADLDSFRGLTLREKMAGWLSRQRMWRMYTSRVREAPVIERLLDLLAKSDALARLIAGQRALLTERHKAAELSLVDIVEQRRRLVVSIDIARLKMKELNAKALTTQGRIGVYGNRAHWEQMEAERRALKAEAERISAGEHEMRDDSQPAIFSRGVSPRKLSRSAETSAVSRSREKTSSASWASSVAASAICAWKRAFCSRKTSSADRVSSPPKAPIAATQ